MELQELVIKQFRGINVKASTTDMEHHQCQSIRDFEISQRPGMLIKGRGYELATDILGNGYTADNKLKEWDTESGDIQAASIENIYQFRTGRASPNDVLYICAANDGTEDRIYYWDNGNSRWQQFDDNTNIGTYDKARFSHRNDALIIGAGIGAANYPVWIKWLEAKTLFGAESYSAGYYDTRNYLPFDTNFSLTNEASYAAALGDAPLPDGGIEAGIYSYFLACEYDDGQIGDVSESLLIRGSLNDDWACKFSLSISNANAAQSVMNNRITGVAIYRAKTSGGITAANWSDAYHIATVKLENPATTDPEIMPVYYYGGGTSGATGVAQDVLTLLFSDTLPIADCMINLYARLVSSAGTVTYHKITDNTTTTVTIDPQAPAELTTYKLSIVSRWFDNGANYECYIYDETLPTVSILDHRNHNQQEVAINYKYAITHKNRMFVAPIYDVVNAETHKNWIGVSVIDGNGNYSYDSIVQFINLEDYGITEIKGIGRMLDYLLIFGDSDIVKLNISSGSEFTWSIEETLQNVGLEAPDSLTYIVGDEFKYNGYYYFSRDGARVYDGYKSELISLPIEDVDNYPINVTTLSEAVGVYNERLKQWIISFPTDSKTWKFDLRTGEWLAPVYADEIDEWCTTANGTLLGTDGDSIFVFEFDGTNNLNKYGGTTDYIDPYWKSKVYDHGDPRIEKILHEVTITYKSSTELTFKFYVDNNSVSSLNGNPFATATSLTTKTVGFPVGVRGYKFVYELSLTSANKETNTYVQVDEIRIGYRYGKSKRFSA